MLPSLQGQHRTQSHKCLQCPAYLTPKPTHLYADITSGKLYKYTPLRPMPAHPQHRPAHQKHVTMQRRTRDPPLSPWWSAESDIKARHWHTVVLHHAVLV